MGRRPKSLPGEGQPVSEHICLPPIPTLWLPASLLKGQPEARRGPAEFLAVGLTYSTVFSRTPTWEDLSRALAPYSLERIVDAINRINAILHHARLPWDSEIQRELCRGVFTERAANAVFAAARRVAKETERNGRPPPLLIFHEQQTLDLLKAAFLLKSIDDRHSAEDFRGIGEALLMVSDLTAGQPGDLSDVHHQDPDYNDRWLQHIMANYLFGSETPDYLDFARSYDLYLEDKPHLRDCGSYVNLPATLAEVTGLSPDALWSALFGLVAGWATKSVEDLGRSGAHINRRTYLSAHFQFTAAETDRFFGLCATDAESFQKAIAETYDYHDLKPFHVLPFARWPLVAFEDRVYATSVRLLAEKLTRGLHHVYLDPRRPKRLRQRYLTYMGEVFEDYVHRLLERVFPPGSGRYVRFDAMAPRFPGPHCDGLIIYEDAVVVLETKGSLFSLEARSGLDIDALRDRMKDLYVDAAAQIEATIVALKDGLKDASGLLPKGIRRFYPVVVTLEDAPMNPLLYREIQRLLDEGKVLQGTEVHAFQCMDVRDLERLEVALDAGWSLRRVLDDKISACERDDSWKNYLFRRRSKFDPAPNVFLQRLFDELNERTGRFYAERRRRDSSEANAASQNN